MAKSKSEQKRLEVQKPAPESVTMSRTLGITLQVGNPVISFSGEWTTKDVKNILRAIPRAYHKHQLSRRKQGEGRFLTQEVSNA